MAHHCFLDKLKTLTLTHWTPILGPRLPLQLHPPPLSSSVLHANPYSVLWREASQSKAHKHISNAGTFFFPLHLPNFILLTPTYASALTVARVAWDCLFWACCQVLLSQHVLTPPSTFPSLHHCDQVISVSLAVWCPSHLLNCKLPVGQAPCLLHSRAFPGAHYIVGTYYLFVE